MSGAVAGSEATATIYSIRNLCDILSWPSASPLTMPPDAFSYRMLPQAEAWHPATLVWAVPPGQM